MPQGEATTVDPEGIVFSGAPGGAGAPRNSPVFLRAGDRVRREVAEREVIAAVFEPAP